MGQSIQGLSHPFPLASNQSMSHSGPYLGVRIEDSIQKQFHGLVVIDQGQGIDRLAPNVLNRILE